MKQTIGQKIIAALKNGPLPQKKISEAIGLPNKRTGAPLWVLKNKGIINRSDYGVYKLADVNTPASASVIATISSAVSATPKQSTVERRKQRELDDLTTRHRELQQAMEERGQQLQDALAIIRYLEDKFIKTVRMVR
jgi:hypothetical protein